MPFVIDDLLLMAALGAGAGALTNKKDPLKGALIGGTLGGVGGAFAPGLLAGAGAGTAGTAGGLLGAEGAATSAAGATGGMGSTLFGSAGLADTAVASGGLLEGGAMGAGSTGLEGSLVGSGAIESGGAAGIQSAAPVTNLNTQAGMFDKLNFQSNGMLGKTAGMAKKAMPVMQAAQMGQEMASANDMPPPPAPMVRNSPPDLNGILQQGYQEQQYIMDDAEKRRRLMQGYAQNMRGY